MVFNTPPLVIFLSPPSPLPGSIFFSIRVGWWGMDRIIITGWGVVSSFWVLSAGCCLLLLANGLDLLADLSGVGLDELTQFVDVAFQDCAHLLDGGLHLGPHAGGLGLQLLAQTLGLGLQDVGDVAQLLVGRLTGLLHIGLHLLPNSFHVLRGAGLELPHVGGNGVDNLLSVLVEAFLQLVGVRADASTDVV